MKPYNKFKLVGGSLILLLLVLNDWGAAYERRTPIVEAVQKVLPVVVNISTTKNITVNTSPFRFYNSQFDELFERTYRLEGLGSGVIVEGGYIVTNNHVIDYEYGPADKIFITFYGEDQPQEAKIMGMDRQADVAILRLEGKKPDHFLPWGKSDDLMIGETVIAIGNALGQPFTVTNGIISALNRTIEENQGRRLNNLIQTNADINQGNSGGPLVNINGEFIGLTTAILSPSGGSVGLGFAIPVFRVKKIYDYWVNGNLTLEDRMGLEIQDLNPPLERFFISEYPSIKNENLHGVVVVQVSAQGLSAKLLKRRDLIYEIDGKSIKNSDDFLLKLEEHQGINLDLGIYRDGQKMKVPIPVPRQVIEKIKWMGMELQELDDHWRRRLDVSDELSGLAVVSVQSDSRPGKAGIREGDVILGINDKKVETLEVFRTIQKTLGDAGTIEAYIYRKIDLRGKTGLVRF